MSLDVAALRAHFPALAEGAAHFDGPGGSQVPDVVAEAVASTLTAAIANRGTVTRAEQRAERVVQEARAAHGRPAWRRPARHRLRPQHDRPDLRHGADAVSQVGRGGRGRRHPPRP